MCFPHLPYVIASLFAIASSTQPLYGELASSLGVPDLNTMPHRMTDNIIQYVKIYISEGMPDKMTNRMSEFMSDRMPEYMSDKVPDKMPERTRDEIADQMSSRMPEYMSARFS